MGVSPLGVLGVVLCCLVLWVLSGGWGLLCCVVGGLGVLVGCFGVCVGGWFVCGCCCGGWLWWCLCGVGGCF